MTLCDTLWIRIQPWLRDGNSFSCKEVEMPESEPLPVEILVGGSFTEPVHIELTRIRTPKVVRRKDREDENEEENDG